MFVDRIHERAARHPDLEALVSPDRRLTYGDLIGRVEAKAAALRHALPDTGRVVGIAIRDELENLIACLAVMAAGGISAGVVAGAAAGGVTGVVAGAAGSLRAGGAGASGGPAGAAALHVVSSVAIQGRYTS